LAEIPEYDVVIIGSGPGGYVAAIRAGQLGLKTALVEKSEKFGGTCLHWGCIPTKALLFDAEVYDYLKKAKEYGFLCGNVAMDWAAVLARKRKIVTRLAKGVEFLLKKNNVETIRGCGRIAAPGRVSVTAGRHGGLENTGGKAQAKEMATSNIILATGSEAKLLPGLEADTKTILTNKEILELREVPQSIIIVGAGAVGVEFASMFQRFGAQITILEMLPRLVPLEDEEVSAELEKAFRKEGIGIHTQARVERTTRSAKGVSVDFRGPNGKSQTLEAEALLMAVGRAPNTHNLGLEKTRVQLERGFVKVNAFMQTDEPGVYAIGDIVAGSPLLAHVGEMEGIVAVTHAAAGTAKGATTRSTAEPINYRQVPNCTYCDPEIASVGVTERQAREAGHQVRVGKFPFSANSKAAILGAREGFVKIVSDETYGELLGVHMIGPRVTEMIAEAVVAMRLEGTAEDLAHTIHPHPTLTEAVLEAAHAAADQAIHI
jgi:dihydrolipoamide dehydrogenase